MAVPASLPGVTNELAADLQPYVGWTYQYLRAQSLDWAYNRMASGGEWLLLSEPETKVCTVAPAHWLDGTLSPL